MVPIRTSGNKAASAEALLLPGRLGIGPHLLVTGGFNIGTVAIRTIDISLHPSGVTVAVREIGTWPTYSAIAG